MNELANIYRGKSFTIGFAIPETYDTDRIEDIKINIGTKIYAHTIVQGVVKVELTSEQTARMVGKQDVVFTIQDNVFGVRKLLCGYIYVSSTISKFESESYNDVYDVLVMLSYNEGIIDVDHVLFDYLKGKSAYEYAVEGGYEGTEEQYYLDLAKAAIAVPYTGADKDVDLGENGITLDDVSFNENPTGAIDALHLQYSPEEKTLEFGLADGGRLQIGKEMFEEYTNIDTVALTNGMIVSTAAIPGNRKGIKRTDFTSLTSIRSIVGMVTVDSIATNQSGRVTTKGVINELNTNGWAEGSQLWGNPSVLGGWSGNKPAKPQYAVQIGQVVVSSATVGSVELNIANDVKFSDLADVDGTTTLMNNADLLPKKESDGVVRFITYSNVKADLKNVNDALYEPILGFTPVDSADLGQPNGVATLDNDGLVPASQLPSFVDDIVDAYGTYTDVSDPTTVIELWTDATHTVAVAKYTGKIYVDVVTRFQFRWTGSVWGAILYGPVQSVAGKTGNVLLVKGDVGLSNVDNTSDVNKPISTAVGIALGGKVSTTGDETIAGVKTFQSSPIVPDNATGKQAINYDGAVAYGEAIKAEVEEIVGLPPVEVDALELIPIYGANDSAGTGFRTVTFKTHNV